MTSGLSAKYHPFVQLIYLVLMVFAGIFLASAIGALILISVSGGNIGNVDMYAPQTLHALKWAQICYTALGFLLPAWIFSFMTHDRDQYLPIHDPGRPLLFPLVVLVMAVSMPMMEYLVTLNDSMKLPAGMQGLEKWMKNMEETNKEFIKALLDMPDKGALAFNFVLIALLPALAEEFLFRGCIQEIFRQWTRNGHLAIWITAFIFSFIHFQFYGFLPRMVLGALFGYLVYWSGSLWPGIFAHMLNNGMAVLSTYLYQQKIIQTDPDTAFFPFYSYFLSIALTIAVLLLYRRTAGHTVEHEIMEGEN
ncbi:MAG: CPBP family intramembrane metalloprotease [Mucilaginibacter polytrichastri]|nr:CPBP family intramembrane metalloprotease [Mucilaginibacter polytrichastri]